MVEPKQTDLGQFPCGWGCVTLGELFNITSSKRVFQSDWRSSGVPFYRARELAVLSETGKVDNDLFINPSLYEKYTRDYGAIQPDDILITGVGTLGKVYVVKDGDKFYFKDGNIIWLKASGKVASKYVMQQFRFSLLLNQVFGTSAGSTVGTYTITNAKVTQIPLPPLPEQRAIAAALSDVDGYIAALARLIAKKRNIKKGAMQELLTGKRRLPGFRGEWIETTLGRIGEFSKGRGVSKAEAHSGKIPCIRYGEIYTIHNDFVKVFYSHISPAVAASSCQLSCGDLLFAGSGETKEEIGKCVAFVSNCEAYAGGDTIILTPFDNYDSLFLGYYLNSRKIVEQKASRGQGDAIVHIHIQSLSEIEVRLPATHEEQSAIAAILSDMDAEIDALTTKLDKVRNIKQGMMQELLTGRIRLVVEETEAVSAVKPAAEVVKLPKRGPETAAAQTDGHNKAIEDAVVLAVVADLYATDQYPLTPFYAQKFPYLLHRHMEGVAQGYHKLAAGPYNAELKYKTALPIAKKNKYVVARKSKYMGTSYEAMLVGDNIGQAKKYFAQWHGDEPLKWLEQFRYIKNRRDELELLSTVDMAMVELRAAGVPITVQAVKEIIQASPEWEAKLKREIFSDVNIARAIKWSDRLFGQGG